MLTETTIYRELGLRDPEKWAAEARQRNQGSHLPKEEARVRRTGRTTRAIVSALVTISKGKPVVFQAHDQQYARYMANEARGFARRLGLNPRLIRMPGSDIRIVKDHGLP